MSMQLSPELKNFIEAHQNDNTDKLLLSAARFPDIDVAFAVNQILARRQIQDKLPDWYANRELIFPSRLSAEQCSSELTARYKQQLLRGTSFCDLTGGLGIDTWFFARNAKSAIYVERFPEYCTAAAHNFAVLQADQIQVINADCRGVIDHLKADTFYLDPARRSGCNQRLFALPDCEPDVLQLKPLLLEQAQRVIIKLSPMADLEETLRLLPETKEIHILAVKNECKELLFVLEGECRSFDFSDVVIHTVNLHPSHPPQTFHFALKEEKEAEQKLSTGERKYLYEPNSALLKSGAFKLPALRFDMEKLHRHSHLYVSESLCHEFPGRIFQIDHIHPFSGKLLKQLTGQLPKANLTVRNFSLTVAEIRKRSGIKEGGDIYLFATTLANNEKVLIQCRKI